MSKILFIMITDLTKLAAHTNASYC